MKTTVIASNKGNGKLNNSAISNKADSKGEQVNGLPISKDFNQAKPETKKEESQAPAQAQNEQSKQHSDNAQSPKENAKIEPKEVAQPKAETKNEEHKAELKAEKPALNLESTLKLVEELHRRKMQRDRLLETIDTLEAFEIAQKEDAEETDNNHFQGCVLTIEDDERRKFTTKNPVIIQAVAQFVNRMCVDRLAEIEAGIIIPA